ncbi:MAG: M23 family metallopeptidase [Gordonia sp. (in: high G+C Gram-positive bacteria)]|uniref:M23 family metallopeptidase n=1 Tax=Gordonia sp. (in: high G+C Gram-positive bacteria) TaxID=84139 RepID=UPI003BB7901D
MRQIYMTPIYLTTTIRAAVSAAVLLLLGSVSGPVASGRGAYDWPLVPRPAVARGFDPPAQRWLPGHRGVDLAAPAEAAVLSAGAGTVRFAGRVVDRGVVSVVHPDQLTTTYEPVRPIVRAGQTVGRGQVLGYLDSGHPDCPAAACLHWGARRGTGATAAYLNPLMLVGAVRVRLKPVGTWP